MTLTRRPQRVSSVSGIAVLTLSLLAVGRVSAQPVLPCDQPQPGTISNPIERDLYLISVEAPGDRIRIDLATTGGEATFDPRWRLLDATTGIQVQSDGGYCGNYNFFPVGECTVPAGSYRVEVADLNLAATGTYELELTRLVAACEETSLPCDSLVADTIDQHLDRDQFVFTAQGGERVRIDLAKTGGEAAFDPRWRLLDATTGVQVQSDGGYCGNYDFFPVGECTLATGTYRVEVADHIVAAAGSYELQLTRLVAACDQTPLPCGEITDGAIQTHFDRDLFSFSAAVGNRVRVDLLRTGGDDTFDPRWRLLDATTGIQVQSDGGYCGNYESFPVGECTLPGGSYYVEVADRLTTPSTGTYELLLTPLNFTCMSTTTTSTVPATSTSTIAASTTTTSSTVPTTSTTPPPTTTTSSSSTLPTTTVAPTSTSTAVASTSTTSTSIGSTSTTLAGASCGSPGAPMPDGTPCDNGDACLGDTCQDGACRNDPLCEGTVAEQEQPGDKPVKSIAVRCSIDGATGICQARGFVPRSLVNDLLGKRRPTNVTIARATVPDDADVPVTKKARAKFDRFGVARFSLKLNRLGKKLLSAAQRLGIPLEVTVKFGVGRKGDLRELRRIVRLARGAG